MLQRGIALACLLLSLPGCGGEAEPLTFSLYLSPARCPAGPCGSIVRGSGVVFSSDPLEGSTGLGGSGELVVFLDFEKEDGALSVLELTLREEDLELVRLDYREVRDGLLWFKGLPVAQELRLQRVGDSGLVHGTFAFTLIDPRFSSDQDPPLRVLSLGVLAPRGQEPAAIPVPPVSGAPRREVPPQPDDPDDPGIWVEVEAEGSGCDEHRSEEESSGCDGPSDGGGCDSSSESSGCEGDTVDAGSGCDGGSGGGGCEGDLDSGGGGCDGCSSTGSIRGRAFRGSFRLLWPVVLVGWINRRWRVRARRSAPNRRESPRCP